MGKSLYSLKGCQRRIITLLPLASHMHAHKSSGKCVPLHVFCTHTHAHPPSPGVKITNFKRLDTWSYFPPFSLPSSLYCLLSSTASPVKPQRKFHSQWGEEPFASLERRSCPGYTLPQWEIVNNCLFKLESKHDSYQSLQIYKISKLVVITIWWCKILFLLLTGKCLNS